MDQNNLLKSKSVQDCFVFNNSKYLEKEQLKLMPNHGDVWQ